MFAATLALCLDERPAHAFTFNLTPKAVSALMRDSRRFVESLRRALNRELKRRGIELDQYVFGVDVDWDKRLHLHGAFVAEHELVPAIRVAMKSAWGEWRNPRQLDIRPLYDDGWAYYVTRNRRRVTKIIGKTVTITNPLRREAESMWVRVGTIIGEACEIMESGMARDANEAMELLDMGVSPQHLH